MTTTIQFCNNCKTYAKSKEGLIAMCDCGEKFVGSYGCVIVDEVDDEADEVQEWQ